MKTYKCDSCRSIQASSLSEAARLAAERIARRNYGRRAEVGALRADSYSQDGSSFSYEAFIGRPNRRERSISGGNVRFVIYTR